jgi:hypothetical protein
MTYHRIKYYLAYSFLLICGVILCFNQDIRIIDVVFVEFYSYLLGVIILSYLLFFTKKRYVECIEKSIWKTLLFFSFPFVFSFLFSNVAGSYLIIKEIPDGMSTSLMNFFVIIIFILLLSLCLYLFRNDKISIKKIGFVATLYISALINRILLYVIDCLFSMMLLVEIISIVSTIALYFYLDLIYKSNRLSINK